MRWLAIANPAAGRAHDAERMIARLRALPNFHAEIVRTAAPGDATQIANGASRFDGLVAIGGDGTIGEILQGIDLARQRLAVLPAGHGNCLARDLGVGDPERALAALERGECWPIDLMDVAIDYADGRSASRLCASTLAVGYVTEVVLFGRVRLPCLGRAAYAVAAMVAMPERFEALVAGSATPVRRRSYTGLVINNTAHLANFRGFPDASIRDGMLDVMEQDYRWPRQLLHNLAVLAGSRAFGPHALRQATYERLELDEARTFMADGELLAGVSGIAVRCRPAAALCIAGHA